MVNKEKIGKWIIVLAIFLATITGAIAITSDYEDSTYIGCNVSGTFVQGSDVEACDQDYNSWLTANFTNGITEYAYWNFTLIEHADNTTSWYGIDEGSNVYDTVPTECYINPTQMKIEFHDNTTFWWEEHYCNNGTDWIFFENTTNVNGISMVYMLWNVTLETNFDVNWTYTNLYVDSNITLNCTTTGTNITNTSFIVNNTLDGTETELFNTTTNTTYTILDTDLFDSMELICKACVDYDCQYSTINPTIENDSIDKRLYIRAKNWIGTTLTNAYYLFNEINETRTGGTITMFMSDFINRTTRTANHTINVTDLDEYNKDGNFSIEVDETDDEFNLTLDANQLELTFEQDGSPINTSGYIADLEKVFEFYNTSYTLVQQNLTEGRVNVRFGTVIGTNFTQHYEYNNDFTNKSLTFELLQDADWTAYIKILDYTEAPLEDVTIRMESAYHSQYNWTTFGLTSQRLTNEEGVTWFYADTDTEVLFTIMKDGYEAKQLLVTIGEEEFTADNPLTVYIKADETDGVKDNAWMYVKRGFTNRSLDLTGTIVAKDYQTVSINTQYRIDSGLEEKQLTGDSIGRYTFTIVSGTDFSLTTTDDITLYIYLDGSLWRTITISYDTSDKNSIFNMESISGTILNPILFIALIFISTAIGTFIKVENSGTTTFFIGGIIISIISTGFLWLSFICASKYGFEYIKKVISE